MNLDNEFKDISVSGHSPIPDIERATVKKLLESQPNPPSEDYLRNFISSSIDG